jgi:hypothetical protein
VEADILFENNVARKATLFPKRLKKDHPAAGESGRLSKQTPGLEPTA